MNESIGKVIRWGILILAISFGMRWFLSHLYFGKPPGRTVIEYSYWVGIPEEIEANRLIIAAFHQAHPDIHVIVRHHPWADYFTKLFTGLVTQTAADVFRMSYAFLPDYVHYKAIQPLNQYIEKDTTFHLNELVDWPFESCIIDNQIFMLPVDCPIDLLFYNKDMFDRAGVSYPDTSWTWEELLQASLKLKNYFQANRIRDVYPLLGLLYSQFVMENGGRIIDRDRMVCTLDTPEAIGGVQFMRDLILYYGVSIPPDAESTVGGDPFLKQKCAMTYGQAIMMHPYTEKATFDWDITFRPRGRFRLAKTLACGLCLNPKSREKEAAWQLMKFFVGETAQKIFSEIGAFVPIRKEVLFSTHFLPPGYKPAHKHLLLQVNGSISQNWICRNWGRFRSELRQEIDLVMEGKISAEEGCRRATVRGNRVLDEIYRQK